MNLERLQFLLHGHFDQALSAGERAELEQMLLASAGAREAFWEMARWNALLRQWGEAEWGRRDASLRDVPARQPKAGWRGRLAGARWAWGVAAALALGLGVHQFTSERTAPLPTIAPAVRNAVAVLASTAEAVWSDPAEARQAGQALQPGWLRLTSGAVQIEFARGARVVLEGPAEFRLISENNAELRTGRMRAHVPPPAKGFTITTPGMVMVDRGTEFACSVPVAGAPEVHVFVGEVDLNLARSGGAFQSLRENQAVRVHGGQTQSIQSDTGAFLNEQALARRTAENIRIRVANWRKASGRFSQHPNAAVHLDFEPEGIWQRFVENRVTNGVPRSVVSIIGSDWEYGRWPGKLALEFKRTDDRLRLAVPGSPDSLTLMAWVRVDSLMHPRHALLMSDGIQRGAIHWYLQSDGRVGLGIHTADESAPNGWRHILSAPALRPERFGAWVFLATVVDAATGVVTHYCDGVPVGRAEARFPKPLRPGTGELGNWSVHPGEAKWSWFNQRPGDDYMRHFRGRMDEFALLTAPLDAAEIARLYEAGRPGDSTSVRDVMPLAKAF